MAWKSLWLMVVGKAMHMTGMSVLLPRPCCPSRHACWAFVARSFQRTVGGRYAGRASHVVAVPTPLQVRWKTLLRWRRMMMVQIVWRRARLRALSERIASLLPAADTWYGVLRTEGHAKAVPRRGCTTSRSERMLTMMTVFSSPLRVPRRRVIGAPRRRSPRWRLRPSPAMTSVGPREVRLLSPRPGPLQGPLVLFQVRRRAVRKRRGGIALRNLE